MAWQVKVLVAEPDDLSSVPGRWLIWQSACCVRRRTLSLDHQLHTKADSGSAHLGL